MQAKQEITYCTSIVRAGGTVKGVLLKDSAGEHIRMSSKTIVAELSLTHDHRGITPKNWREQLYMLANVSNKGS